SPLLLQHPDWVSWRRNGTPECAGYGDVAGVSLWSGYNDYALDRYRTVLKATGFDGFLVDSHLTFGIYADYSQAQPEPQLKKTLATYRAWSQMGCRYLMLEGCAPFGISSGGFPGADAWEPGIPAEMRVEADRRLGWLKNKEYGLYRYVAETKVYSGEAYYRALAAGGQITPAYLDVYADLSSETRERIRRTNGLYNRLSDKMQRRRLIGTGDTWQAVAWSRDGSAEVVLFALETFGYPVREAAFADDLTTGTRLEITDSLAAEPGHVYVIRDGNGEGG
ncbi:MAG: hypothetical protein GY953_26825, partial [bacterium]|nr:hypothetical protein [bacterium]